MTVKLVVDENIPALDQLFAGTAEIVKLPGRAITARDLQKADALIVRSVTQVDEQLLRSSPVSFVGTATIGTEHIDLDYLQDRGIHFASAPGSNAASVADYVCSALASLLPDLEDSAAKGRVAGVVGYGQVGSRVVQRFLALGFDVRVFDPFLTTEECPYLSDWESVLQCGVISVHVPLTCRGQHPTQQLFSKEIFSTLPTGCVLINTSRGAVFDGAALKQRLQAGKELRSVLDVWEAEPKIDPGLLAMTCIGTPHIAGYAADAKLRGSQMIAQAFYQHFALVAPVVQELMPPTTLAIDSRRSLSEILLSAYDVRVDDASLRACIGQSIGPCFDALRKNYPVRREFSKLCLQLDGFADDHQQATLQALGFSC